MATSAGTDDFEGCMRASHGKATSQEMLPGPVMPWPESNLCRGLKADRSTWCRGPRQSGFRQAAQKRCGFCSGADFATKIPQFRNGRLYFQQPQLCGSSTFYDGFLHFETGYQSGGSLKNSWMLPYVQNLWFRKIRLQRWLASALGSITHTPVRTETSGEKLRRNSSRAFKSVSGNE